MELWPFKICCKDRMSRDTEYVHTIQKNSYANPDEEVDPFSPFSPNNRTMQMGEVAFTDDSSVQIPRAMWANEDSQEAATLASLRKPGHDQCQICCEEQVSLVTYGCKKHSYCLTCAQRHMEERLSNGHMPICPAENCHTEVDVRLAERLLSKLSLKRYLMLKLCGTNLQTCPNCFTDVFAEGQGNQANHHKHARDDKGAGVKCPKCSASFCMACGMPWGKDHHCEQAQQAMAEKMKERGQAELGAIVMQCGLKPCPGCGVFCEKLDGCDHVICGCKHEFCWTCMADRQPIAAHGNHFHLPTCPFYAAEYMSSKTQERYLPDKCNQCKKRGRACSPPARPSAERQKAPTPKEQLLAIGFTNTQVSAALQHASTVQGAADWIIAQDESTWERLLRAIHAGILPTFSS